jgi:hypothetical protein
MRSLSFAILLLSVALLCLGHGLQGSLIAISANKAEFRTDVTGLIMSGYSGGMLLSALLTPRLIRNVGHVRAFAGLASIVSTVILLIPLLRDCSSSAKAGSMPLPATRRAVAYCRFT